MNPLPAYLLLHEKRKLIILHPCLFCAVLLALDLPTYLHLTIVRILEYNILFYNPPLSTSTHSCRAHIKFPGYVLDLQSYRPIYYIPMTAYYAYILRAVLRAARPGPILSWAFFFFPVSPLWEPRNPMCD